MKVATGQPYTVNTEAVKRVASMPFVQDMSAITKAVMAAESAGVVNAKSPTGVRGPMQVTGRTARGIAQNPVDVADPLTSTILGAIELEKVMANPLYKGNPMLGLTSYNGGEAVTARAIELAGTTDWNVVKNYLEEAVLTYPNWEREGLRPDQIPGKAKEVRAYAERVVSNFPAFARTAGDMEIARSLKAQGVVKF
jgi:hypothetical protein